jgi:hypothetical protein
MLDGLMMRPEILDPGSALSTETRFRFAQRGTLVSAEYDGGSIDRGYLVGKLEDRRLEFRYVQMSRDGQIDAGHSRCDLVLAPDGLRLVERFAWQTRDGTGTNVLVQCT